MADAVADDAAPRSGAFLDDVTAGWTDTSETFSPALSAEGFTILCLTTRLAVPSYEPFDSQWISYENIYENTRN